MAKKSAHPKASVVQPKASVKPMSMAQVKHNMKAGNMKGC